MIAPVASGASSRPGASSAPGAPIAPRISLVLLACNQRASARAAAESCLAQRCEPIEIVLSDDASTDGTFDELQAVAAAYTGPHRVRARRNETNLGIGAHYNRLMRETTGELLVTAAADDLSLPNRVQRLAEAWDASGGRLDLIASHFVDMAPDGSLGEAVAIDDLSRLTLDAWCRRRPYTVGATHAFTRRMMDRFGPFVPGVWYEDPVMTLRALLTGGAATLPEPLVCYRRGGSSRWPAARSGEALTRWVRTQSRRVIAEIAQHTQDAALMGVAQPVAAALAPTLARERCLAALADAHGAAQRWQAAREATTLPWPWRLRKLLTFTFPDQAAQLKRAKAQWRGRETG